MCLSLPLVSSTQLYICKSFLIDYLPSSFFPLLLLFLLPVFLFCCFHISSHISSSSLLPCPLILVLPTYLRLLVFLLHSFEFFLHLVVFYFFVFTHSYSSHISSSSILSCPLPLAYPSSDMLDRIQTQQHPQFSIVILPFQSFGLVYCLSQCPLRYLFFIRLTHIYYY